MAITKEAKERLKELGIDADALAAAMADTAEVDFALPTGSIYEDSAITQMKDRVKKGHESAYPEIFGKHLNEELALGLSVTDAKDQKKLLEAISKKAVADAKIDPDKKVKELQESLKKLQEEVLPAEQGKTKEWETKYNERMELDKYAALIPENANKFLTKEEHIERVKKAYQLNADGTLTDRTTGKIVRDTMEKEIPASKVITDLYTSREGWLQPANAVGATKTHGVTGGPSSGNTKVFDHDSAIAKAEASGYASNDPRYMSIITEAALSTK